MTGRVVALRAARRRAVQRADRAHRRLPRAEAGRRGGRGLERPAAVRALQVGDDLLGGRRQDLGVGGVLLQLLDDLLDAGELGEHGHFFLLRWNITEDVLLEKVQKYI